MRFGEILGCSLLVLLCLAGLTALLQALCRWLLAPGKESEMVVLVPIRGHCTDAEMVLRSAIRRIHEMGGSDRKMLLCVDCGMDEETHNVCERICSERSGAFLVKIEEVSSYLHCNSPENQL